MAGPEINTGHFASVITAAETNQLKSTVGKVGHVVVWGDDAGTSAKLILYDAISGTTRPVWQWITAEGKGTFPIQMPIGLGIRIITSGTPPTNGGWTVVWS